MDKPKQIDELAKKLSGLMPGSLQNLQSDIEENVKSTLESGLRKMNLVTREEFDIQRAVLLRTREKLEALEKVVADLESSLSKESKTENEK
ncbi:accessory factor UbiK family protein [Cocleimonas sp. KMM 6892]|uniref:ubiquinone biosynthesis accessory factor UbiK n=1 Tax=unclassified Cocleimonas TaxID=2639732 RepID=UPI002DB5FD6A|nr:MULTISPECIES: accessory factor UbiK family protein [unclassified Cocleimonas]MEB8432384.1 accessory factor UbiK family protein [Cocleimonas sp. KMM 6892]MEC4715243.1 accessory factor UbiK family protein [Cocleimonas sp. KMM 6895]MEC4745138.1 accessory factor UbiK family protein [Cocleimonas sp. KMM 6896]